MFLTDVWDKNLCTFTLKFKKNIFYSLLDNFLRLFSWFYCFKEEKKVLKMFSNIFSTCWVEWRKIMKNAKICCVVISTQNRIKITQGWSATDRITFFAARIVLFNLLSLFIYKVNQSNSQENWYKLGKLIKNSGKLNHCQSLFNIWAMRHWHA